MKTKILIVDDHQLVIDGLSAIVKELKEYEIVGKASNGKEAISLSEMLSPNLVLMDIDMPIMNGLEACRRIKTECPQVSVLILTMHNEPSLVRKVMEIGADGYVLKNADREEFYNALCSIAKGKKYFSAEVTESLLNTEGKNKANFNIDNNTLLLAKLTERELDVLKLIAEGFSNKEIGEHLFISHRTVDTHRTNLMKKLDAHNVAALIKFAIKNGLVE